MLTYLITSFGWMAKHIGSLTNGIGGDVAQPPTPYNKFIDAFWRLPRVLMVLAIFAMFGWSIENPPGFGEWITQIAKIPDGMWTIILTVIVIVMGIKKLRGDLAPKILIGDDSATPLPPPPAGTPPPS